MTALTTKIGV